MLAGLLKAPSKFSPLGSALASPARAARVVLKKMHEAGILDEAQWRAAAAQSVQFVLSRAPKQLNGTEYAVEYVMEQVLGRLGDLRGDLTIETTLTRQFAKARSQGVLRERVLVLEGAKVTGHSGCRRHSRSRRQHPVPSSAGDRIPKANTTGLPKAAAPDGLGLQALRVSRRSRTAIRLTFVDDSRP